MTRREVAAIQALGEGLVGTGKPLVTTSGTLVMPAGRVSTEQDPAAPTSIGSLRIPGEQACLSFTERCVRAVVLRLAPTVHGPRDHGFIPMLIVAARATGVLAYVGGRREPLAGRPPARRGRPLPARPGEGPAGQVVHGVGEDAVPFLSIAEKIGEQLGVQSGRFPPRTPASTSQPGLHPLQQPTINDHERRHVMPIEDLRRLGQVPDAHARAARRRRPAHHRR